MLTILSGASSSGKDTIQNIISKRYNLPVCVSSTTRPMREGETEGKEYHFISEDQFLNELADNKLLEHREYSTIKGKWYYGLSVDSVDLNKNQVTIVDQQGYYEIVSKLGKENVIGIHITAPEEIKFNRACKREVNNKTDEFYLETYRRLSDDIKSFDKIKKDDNVYKVENIDLDKAISEIDKILTGKD